MGDFKHLALVRFKEGVAVEELLAGMKKLASEIDAVKSFEWGEDVGNEQMLSQGFTHVFILSFRSPGDLATYVNHPNHVEYAKIFGAALEKVLLIDFPAVTVKSCA